MCGGFAINLTVLRKTLHPEAINQAWIAAWKGPFGPGRKCPSCSRSMAEVPIALVGQTVKVDVCKSCQFFWFDPGELEEMPLAPDDPAADPQRKLPQAAREALAILEVQRMAEQARIEQGEAPDADWKSIPALFGLPVEAESRQLSILPWFTWILVALVSACSLSAFFDLPEAIRNWGLIPDEWLRMGGLTLVTSFFVHGGWMHLLGNIWFLLMLGEDVEELLGWKRMALLLGASALLGDLAHILAGPNSLVPAIGASSGVAGLIAFYTCKFPRARICLLLRHVWVQLPAWAAFLCWTALQVIGSALDYLQNLSTVSFSGQLGGIAAGFLFWLTFHRLEPAPADEPSAV